MQYFEIMIIGNYIETVEACKSACKSVYSDSKFGRTCNYSSQNYVGLSGTICVP